MINFFNTCIPVFFHIPKNAGSFVRSWQRNVLENECENRNQLRSILITNKEKDHILKLEVIDQKKITNNKIFLKNKHFDKKTVEVDLEDFNSLKDKKQIQVFCAAVLADGFCMHTDLLEMIQETWGRAIKAYMILRDPLENEWSFYNYTTTRNSQHEKNKYRIKSKSFKEYVYSEEMSDSWLIRSLTGKKEELSDEDYNKVVKILDNIKIFNIKNSDDAVQEMFEDCYSIKVDFNHNAVVNKNKSKIPFPEKKEIGNDLIEIFKNKKKYDYKIYNKYIENIGCYKFLCKKIENLKKEDCFFCQDMSFDDEKVMGTWDLSECIQDYLGDTDFKNKKVIDIGAGSGYNSFYMEKMGAEVVSHEIPNGYYWDLFKHPNSKKVDKKFNQPMINGYWYAHSKNKSKNKLFLWDIYKDIPDELGYFDIAVFSMVLSHFRDPFLALMNVLYKTKEKAILVNTFSEQDNTTGFFYGEDGLWWELSKQCTHCFMEKIGFRLTSEKIVLPYNNDDSQTKEYKCLVFERY